MLTRHNSDTDRVCMVSVRMVNNNNNNKHVGQVAYN